MKSVEFYFDLGSPYSYLAYYRLLQMAEQQEMIDLGIVFKARTVVETIEAFIKASGGA